MKKQKNKILKILLVILIVFLTVLSVLNLFVLLAISASSHNVPKSTISFYQISLTVILLSDLLIMYGLYRLNKQTSLKKSFTS